MHLVFPSSHLGWTLDLAGLTAIIGEAAIGETAQALTASKLTFLPRLLPAPHALIRPSRTKGLPLNTNCEIYGIFSGTRLEYMPYFADVIHATDLSEPFSVREYEIRTREDAERGPYRLRAISAVKFLTIGSSLLAFGLLVWAILLHDGPAVIAILLMSVSASVTCAASHWTIMPPERSEATGPKSDVVIRSRNGAFDIVHCHEDVAREIYNSPPQCVYLLDFRAYQICITLGTAMLMFGIVVMASCSWKMQLALGASYLLLNGLYLLLSMSKPATREHFWDLSRFHIILRPPLVSKQERRSYTEALWLVIRATRSIDWIIRSNLVPQTESWKKWLQHALMAAEEERTDWDAIVAKDQIFMDEITSQAQADSPRTKYPAMAVDEPRVETIEKPRRRFTGLV